MSQAIDTPTITLIFSIGAFLISLICLYAVVKKPKTQSKKPKKSTKKLFGIRPEFIKEAKSEREHRLKQRRKYGIFDDDKMG